jgi:septum formation protein
MLVLASASPRRSELLTQAGFSFEVQPAHIPEDPLPGEDPIAYVTRLAREKAEAVFRERALGLGLTTPAAEKLLLEGKKCQGTTSVGPQRPFMEVGALAPETGAPTPDSEAWESKNSELHPTPSLVVLGADTTVTLDDLILGKPEDAADAARMLRMLSGRTHRVITGVAVVTAVRTEAAAEVTAVRFLNLRDEEIAAYIATGEPMDKAGAYGIQGYAARWIPRVEGCYFNVMGLPIALVVKMLDSL